MINKERLLERFLRYVQIDSPTSHEKEMALHLVEEMKAMGMDAEIDNVGEQAGSNTGNVIGRLKGTGAGKTILLSAHMDTVSPGVGVKPHIKDGVIYSDGTTVLGGDDKSGIAAILEAIETIVEKGVPHGDIEVVFSVFEEGGLYGVKHLDTSALKAEHVFVFDSGGAPGEIIIQGPSQNKMVANFIGQEAHAGVAPETGISAISMAAQAISQMNLLRIDEETTANIGSITGGDVTNIVAGKASFTAEARSLDDEKLKKQIAHMTSCCLQAAEKFGGKVDIHVDDTYRAFKVDPKADIVQRVRAACDTLGFPVVTKASGGGSDTNIYASKGFAALNLGTGMSKVHTVNEYISIEDLESTARLVLEIVKEYHA